jgi:hypothetical protein
MWNEVLVGMVGAIARGWLAVHAPVHLVFGVSQHQARLGHFDNLTSDAAKPTTGCITRVNGMPGRGVGRGLLPSEPPQERPVRRPPTSRVGCTSKETAQATVVRWPRRDHCLTRNRDSSSPICMVQRVEQTFRPVLLPAQGCRQRFRACGPAQSAMLVVNAAPPGDSSSRNSSSRRTPNR